MEEVIEDVRPPAAGEVLVRILPAKVLPSIGTGRKIDLSRGVAASGAGPRNVMKSPLARVPKRCPRPRRQVGDKVVGRDRLRQLLLLQPDQEPLCFESAQPACSATAASQYTMVPEVIPGAGRQPAAGAGRALRLPPGRASVALKKLAPSPPARSC
jgi:hypothetical protein